LSNPFFHCLQVLLGTDSHTCTAGAFGQFATGIGITDAGFVLGAGKLLLKVKRCFSLVSDSLLCCVSAFSMLFDVRILAYINTILVNVPPRVLAIILCLLGCFPLEIYVV